MTYYNKLDAVLIALSKPEKHIFESKDKIQKRISIEIDYFELELILQYLVSLGYAICEMDDSLNQFAVKKSVYKISLHGLLFLEKSSFKSEINKSKRMATWTIAKTIAAILNAIIIVIIGIMSVYVSMESNEDKRENKILNKRVDSLININKSLEKKLTDPNIIK